MDSSWPTKNDQHFWLKMIKFRHWTSPWPTKISLIWTFWSMTYQKWSNIDNYLLKMIKYSHFVLSITYQKCSNLDILGRSMKKWSNIDILDSKWPTQNALIWTFLTIHDIPKMIKYGHFGQSMTYNKWSNIDIFDKLLPLKIVKYRYFGQSITYQKFSNFDI